MEDIQYVDLRRDAHSLKGAASTIGALQLSQSALDLQLATESNSSVDVLRELADVIALQFEMVERDLAPLQREMAGGSEDEAKDGTGPMAGGTRKPPSGKKEPEKPAVRGTTGGVKRGTGPSFSRAGGSWGGGTHGRAR